MTPLKSITTSSYYYVLCIYIADNTYNTYIYINRIYRYRESIELR